VKADEFFMTLSSKLMGGDEHKAKRLFHARAPAVDCGDCCVEAREVYREACGRFTDYSLQYVRVLTNACALANKETLLGMIKSMCL